MKTTGFIDMRQRIIEAAILVAAQAGFTNATTKAIAQKADCSEGIIYHYFKSKHELFMDVIKESGQEFLAQVNKHIEEAKSAEDKITKIVDFHFFYFTGKVHIFQILFGKSGDAVMPFPHVLKMFILPYQQAIEETIKGGIKLGEFQKVNTAVVSTSLLGMMQINIIRLHFGASDIAVDEIKDSVKDLIFNTLLKSKKGDVK